MREPIDLQARSYREEYPDVMHPSPAAQWLTRFNAARGEPGIRRGRVHGAIRSRRAGRADARIRTDICFQRRARRGVFERFRIEIVVVVEIPIIIIVRHWGGG